MKRCKDGKRDDGGESPLALPSYTPPWDVFKPPLRLPSRPPQAPRWLLGSFSPDDASVDADPADRRELPLSTPREAKRGSDTRRES